MADEGLREIRLEGKQLVFLFMASTVVAVVIFLCGVMVGRGVRVVRASELAVRSADVVTDPTASTPPSAGTAASPSSGTPVAPGETLTYPARLEGQDPPDETLQGPTVPPRATAGASASRPARLAAAVAAGPAKGVPARVSPVRAEPVEPAPSAVSGEPAGTGFVVQVAAVTDRREADTIARRLAGKGYPSFVTVPGAGTPRMFRVRVGKYSDRRQAQSIATRLEKEEQFKPWITR